MSSTYSTSAREFYSVVPANSQGSVYASVEGEFGIKRLPQTNVTDITDPSLRKAVRGAWQSVGIVFSEYGQVGSCTLIAHNLAIIPSHCIEGTVLTTMKVVFGYIREGCGESYGVKNVLEYDPNLDYAILQLTGTPGQKHGYLPVQSASVPHTELALLHYPRVRPLQVSVHTQLESSYRPLWLQTLHDTDYGSSGGAYISPSGRFVAMHLGSEQNTQGLNLLRLALPLTRIFETNRAAILSRLHSRSLRPDSVYVPSLHDTSYTFIPKHPRDFIDYETFLPEQFKKQDGEYVYVIRQPEANRPGVYLDSHQYKHSSWWPKPARHGNMGRLFALTRDQTICLAEMVADTIYVFRSVPSEPTFKNISIGVRDLHLLNEAGLKRGLKDVDTIKVAFGFNKGANSWEFHFYPDP